MAIPYGYCHCGCGEKTEIANQTRAARGWIRNEPKRWVAHHHGSRKHGAVSKPFLYKGELVVSVLLSNGKVAIVDANKRHLVEGMTWTYHHAGYASNHGSSNKQVMMHRVILPCAAGYEPDHINHDGLDNRISNLRPVTRSQNTMNSRLRKDNASGVRGVSWDATGKKWVAVIQVKRKHYHLGRFHDFATAKAARLAAEKELHGDFAYRSAPSIPAQ